MAFGFANFIGSPILGALSDRYGRRPVLLIGFSGLALSFFVTAMATALWMLIAVRLFSGAMQANIAVANAYVADITPPADRAKRFGMLGAMFGLGFILGPVHRRPARRHQPAPAVLRAPAAWRCATGSTASSCCPSRCRSSGASRSRWARANPVGSLMHLAQLKGMGALLGVVAFASLAQFILQTHLGALHAAQVRLGAAQIGWSLCAVGAMSVLVQGVLVGRLHEAMSLQRLVVLGLVSSALAYVALGRGDAGLDDVRGDRLQRARLRGRRVAAER